MVAATLLSASTGELALRTREGMSITAAKGRLRGRQPKLSSKQQQELHRMHATGNYTITDLTDIFSVSRPTIYRTLERVQSSPPK